MAVPLALLFHIYVNFNAIEPAEIYLRDYLELLLYGEDPNFLKCASSFSLFIGQYFIYSFSLRNQTSLSLVLLTFSTADTARLLHLVASEP